MKQDIQDRIDDYILDRMSTEDRLRFEDEVSQNALEKDRLDFTRNLRVAVNSREDKMRKLHDMKRKYVREQSSTIFSKRVLLLTSGIAAALIIGLLVVNPFAETTLPSESFPASTSNEKDDKTSISKIDSLCNDTIPRDTIKIVQEIMQIENE